MFPFNLPGPAFLVVYAALLLVATLGVIGVAVICTCAMSCWATTAVAHMAAPMNSAMRA